MEHIDIDFKALPKIELHAHLSGSISRQCLHEIWVAKAEKGEATHLKDPLIEMPPDKFDYDLDTFFPLFSSYIYSLVNDRSSLIYSTNSVLQDFHDDGVVYLELRTTPRAIPSANITKADYVSLILSCMSSFQATHPSMTARLILSIDRRNTVEQASEVISLAEQFRAQGVVGIDLCGDPAQGDVRIFADAFARARELALPITIHFAEAVQSATHRELRALLDFRPDRIGHVIHVSEEFREEIAARKLGLELCLSCNVHAKMITGSYGDHHFGHWVGTECPVVLCTDDVGVFGSPLSNEYRLIAEHFKLSKPQILTLARRGIDCIFASPEEKAKLAAIMW